MYYAVTQQSSSWYNGDAILIAVFLMDSDAEAFVKSISEHATEGKYQVTEISDSKYPAFISMHPKNSKESI